MTPAQAAWGPDDFSTAFRVSTTNWNSYLVSQSRRDWRARLELNSLIICAANRRKVGKTNAWEDGRLQADRAADGPAAENTISWFDAFF